MSIQGLYLEFPAAGTSIAFAARLVPRRKGSTILSHLGHRAKDPIKTNLQKGHSRL